MTSSNRANNAKQEAGPVCRHCNAPIVQWWSARASKGSICGLCGGRTHFDSCAPCPKSPWWNHQDSDPPAPEAPAPEAPEQQQASLFGDLPA